MLRVSTAAVLLVSSLTVLPSSTGHRSPPAAAVLHASLGFGFYGPSLTAFNALSVNDQQLYLTLLWDQLDLLFPGGQDAPITVPGVTFPTQAQVQLALNLWLAGTATPNSGWTADPAFARGESKNSNVRKHRYSFVLSDGGDQGGDQSKFGAGVGKQLFSAVRASLSGNEDESFASLRFSLMGGAVVPTLLVHADLDYGAIPHEVR